MADRNRHVNKSLQGVFLSFLLAWACSGCQSAGRGEDAPHLSIAVGSCVEKLAVALIEEYNRIYPQEISLKVAVVPDSETRATLEQNQASAALHWEEPASENWSARIGWTGIVFVVHPDNPLEDLSGLQAEKIFLGWIDRWEDVGGSSGEIHPIAYSPEAGLEQLFEKTVLGGSRLIPGAILAPSIDVLPVAVLGDSLSIGFVMGFDQTPEIHSLSLDGIGAEYPNFLSRAYPFSIPIFLEAKDPVSPEIRQFAGWIQSVSGQTVLMQLQQQE